MNETTPSGYELRLLRELEDVEGRIRELQQEKLALQRQLLKARWERNALRDVSRKNSGNRVLVEQRILEELKGSQRSLPLYRLLQAARAVNHEIKDATFRTYLHRLKAKGLIENPVRGAWRLVKTDDS